jgi:hypothetical protein
MRHYVGPASRRYRRMTDWIGEMIPLARILNVLVVIGLVVAPSPAGCAAYRKLPVNGILAGKSISTTVDSALAKRYLENSLRPTRSDSELDQRIAEIEQRFQGRPLDWLTLKEVSRETSPDFATLFLIKQSLSDGRNAKFQMAYSEEFNKIRSATERGRRVPTPGNALRRYKLLFIPGFHYLSDQSSGADFYNQRRLFRQLGLAVELAATREDGTIKENAAIIAEIVRAENRSHTQLILISTSKGGPETALALGNVLEANEATSVKAWLSVGGLINGTFLADDVMGWPKFWLTKIALSYSGVDPRSLPEMTTTASRERMKSIRLPHRILSVQVVGMPLSGDIGDDVRNRYIKLRKYGPNDGLTLLSDELLPGGITVAEPGLDHFYRDPEIDLKALALATVVANELERRRVVSSK